MAIPMEAFEPTYNKLTTQDVAKILGVLPRTVTSYIKRGKLSPCYRGSFGKLYFEKSDVLKLKTRNPYQKEPLSFNPNRRVVRTDYEMEIIKQWQVQPLDCSSIDVQIGLLTYKITELEERLKFFQRKEDEMDFKFIRMHLLRLTRDRRRNLDLLRDTDTARYQRALKKIGIKF